MLPKSFVTGWVFSPFPRVTDEILAPGRIPCVQWLYLNNLIQSIEFLALAVIEYIFFFHSLVRRDIKTLSETHEPLVGCDSFITGVDILSLFAWFLNAYFHPPLTPTILALSTPQEHSTSQPGSMGGFV